MWDKIQEISVTVLMGGFSIMLFILFFIYVPIKCSTAIVERIKNPPSEIYAENQDFDEWDAYCIEYDEENCYVYGNRLTTKSLMYVNDDEIDIVTNIEVDEYNMQISIIIRDWNTGDVIQPFPQAKHKWYRFYKSYESYESVGFLLDDDNDVEMGYELTVFRDGIIIDEGSCDSRGYEEKSNIQGGCFFLEQYVESMDEWHLLYIKFRNNTEVEIVL